MKNKSDKRLYKEENPEKVPHIIVPSKGDSKDPDRKIYVGIRILIIENVFI